MDNNILQIQNLSVSLGNEQIIENISFNVKQKAFLTILGPNGSGKTVLLKTLLGIIPPTSGTITWKDNMKIGYLPQGLTPLKLKDMPMSVEEFLLLKKIKPSQMSNLLAKVDIKDKSMLTKKIDTLSGGQFQKILMAWSLANNPDILLFDEPTTGIDVGGEKTIYDLLFKLQKEQGLTVIMITHDFNIVYKYSTDILCISKNKSCHATSPDMLSSKTLEEIYGMPINFYKHHHH